MILNEDYFNDLEIKDEHIIDDVNDVEEPKHELTLEELYELPEQYDHSIMIKIKKIDSDTAFFQTTLIPKLFKRFDTLFKFYGIEHSEYVLTSEQHSEEDYETVVEFGDYQLFCLEDDEDEFINDTYNWFYINVYFKYPQFTYKKAFHFLYTMLSNLYRIDIRIRYILFESVDYVRALYFWFDRMPNNNIRFLQYDKRTGKQECEMSLCDEEEIAEEDKREFYNSIIRHFFGKGVRVPYKLLKRDVPLKPIKLL